MTDTRPYTKDIVPELLEKDFQSIITKLRRLEGITSLIQIDVVDGTFAPYVTWPYMGNDEEGSDVLRGEGPFLWDDFEFEFDCMVSHEEEIEKFIHAGASRLVAHYQTWKDISSMATFLDRLKTTYNAGGVFRIPLILALHTEDPIHIASKLEEHIDGVQLMGIDEVGKQGSPTSDEIEERISELRDLLPHMHISVDGGVTLENAHDLFDAGADRLIVGSSLWKSDDPIGVYDELVSITEEFKVE